MILGIDEVGRGPWAGPLVVGAVVLPEAHTLQGLTDSKKLSAKKRAALDIQIRDQALAYGLGWVYAEEIDSVGLAAALRLATIRAVEAITVPYHEIIIDGTINFLKETAKGQYVTILPKADLLIPAVSAASIIAKVARDTYMAQQDAIYPGYGFGAHVGYGTAQHQKALTEHGVTPLHRRSFAPIKKLTDGLTRKYAVEPTQVSTSERGQAAETRASQWLEANGFTLIERNWKTKYCEIDIIAESITTRYYIEVKYRASQDQGGGTAAITDKKLVQMRFAAEFYLSQRPSTKQQRLGVIALDDSATIELLEVE